MVNSISPFGLTVNSVNDIVAELTLAMQEIYGDDINVDSNSPDGQLINIYAQVAADILELLVDVYNSFAVNSAYGTILDQRVALNGITRRQGTYTITPIVVVVNQALTLTGLDALVSDPTATVFTIQDNAGNKFYLETTKVFSVAATEVLTFRAVDIGLVETTPNTITNQVTTVLGVVSVNNPTTSITTTCHTHSGTAVLDNIPDTTGMIVGMDVTGPGILAGTVILSIDSGVQITVSQNSTATATVTITTNIASVINGVNEETDTQLKIRHAQSFALASTGPADAVSAALLAIPDITDAYVVENVTDDTVNTVPAHAIWCIVTGGTDAEIAQAIYAKKGIGCDMKGSSTLTIGRPNGTVFTAKWDASITEPLYIQFTLNGIVAGTSFDTATIAERLAAALSYKLGQNPNVGDIVTAMQTIAPNGYLTAIGVSDDNISFFDVVTPTDAQHYFTVIAANIDITT